MVQMRNEETRDIRNGNIRRFGTFRFRSSIPVMDRQDTDSKKRKMVRRMVKENKRKRILRIEDSESENEMDIRSVSGEEESQIEDDSSSEEANPNTWCPEGWFRIPS